MKRQIFQILISAFIATIGFSGIYAQTKAAPDKKIEVKIFLQKTLIDSSGATSDESAFVLRRVDARSPLRSALEELFSGEITSEEEAENFWSATYGMKFEGVVLKNGTATIRFSQPPDATNYGSLGPFFFAEAVEKTAKQFSSVKRVKICAVGETLIDSQLEKPFPKCRNVEK